MFRLVVLLGLMPFLSFSSIKHIVQNGESLMTISNLYHGTHQCWKGILKDNPSLKNKNTIEVGDALSIKYKNRCLKKKKLAKTSKKLKKNPLLTKIEKAGILPEVNLDKKDKPTHKKYALQIGSFTTLEEAVEVVNYSARFGFNSKIRQKKIKGQTWYRVHLSDFSLTREARSFAKKKDINRYFSEYFIVPL